MGVYTFAKQMLKAEIRQCIFFVVSIIISNAVLFNLFNLMYNGEFVTFKHGDANYMGYAAITLMVMVIVMVLVFFTNSYFIIKKSKEIAIATLSGRTPGEIASIIGYQNIVIISVGLGLGIVFGIIMMPIFLKIMYSTLGITGSIFTISLEGLMYTSIIVVMEFIWIVMINMGFAFRKEIKDLISMQQSQYTPFKVKYKVPGAIYWIGSLLPGIILLATFFMKVPNNEKYSIIENVILSCSFIACLAIMFHVPVILENFKKKRGYKNRITLMVTSNLQYSFRKIAYIVGIQIVYSINFIVMACKLSDSPLIKMFAIISLVVTTILIALILIYKVAIEAENRKRNFKQLILIGYTNEEVRKIIVGEMVWLYSIIIGIIVYYMIVICAAAIISEVMVISFAINSICMFIAVMLIAYIISVHIYKKSVFKYLNGEC
ncbi:MAG: FtsX-like permease family protein [Clostridium sp.]